MEQFECKYSSIFIHVANSLNKELTAFIYEFCCHSIYVFYIATIYKYCLKKPLTAKKIFVIQLLYITQIYI